MPKIKTRRGVAKRIKITGSGKFKFRHSNTSHLFTSKGKNRKRHLRKKTFLIPIEQKRITSLIT